MQVTNEYEFRAALANVNVHDIRVLNTFALNTEVWEGPPIIIKRDMNITGNTAFGSDTAWPTIWFNDVKSGNVVSTPHVYGTQPYLRLPGLRACQ